MVITELNRLTHEALLILLEEMKRFTWIGGSAQYVTQAVSLPSERAGTQLFQLPPLEVWLQDGAIPRYPFSDNWQIVRNNPVFCIH